MTGAYPIWPHSSVPSWHEVALFRRTFTLGAGWSNVEFLIFADTRYELWLDGERIGRGPARFSERMTEYDRYHLGALEAGEHQLAILVQWAPNARRSESTAPLLMGKLRAERAGRSGVLALTDPSWKSSISSAWDYDAPLVHAWGLIGPTEVLDLGRLPPQWADPSFDDSAWPGAVVVEGPPGFLAPRSIPFLTESERLPVAVVESGLLSPGRTFLDFDGAPAGSNDGWTEVKIESSESTTLTVEALTAEPLSLDDEPLPEPDALEEPRRPDVLVNRVPLPPGVHSLKVHVNESGRTLAVDTGGAVASISAPEARYRAPDRMLLAEPVPADAGGPSVTLTAEGATIEVGQEGMPAYVVLDFGRTIHARPSALVTGPEGTIVSIGWDERLWHGRPLPVAGSLHSNLWRQVDTWHLDGTPRLLMTLDTRAGRYMLLQLWGAGPVHFSGVSALEEHYPITPIGDFESSDPLLNRIWHVGVDSLLPNMTDAYTDTPWRERGQWWGDVLVGFYTNQVVYGDAKLFARGLRQVGRNFLSSGRPVALAPSRDGGGHMLDFGMLWVEGLYRYWRYTDDLDLVRELYPTARRFLSYLEGYERESSLLYVPTGLHWTQSALIDWSAGTSRTGESTALNSLYAATLQWMSEMSAAQGYASEAEAYARRNTQVTGAITRALYVNDAEGYAASRVDDELLAPVAQAQAWALTYDVAPPDRREQVALAMLDQLSPFFTGEGVPRVDIYGMRWVFEGLVGAGDLDSALQLMREQYGRLLEEGATTWWETFISNTDYDASLSHLWGSSPTWILSNHLLGAQQDGPGRWRVAPEASRVGWARGSIPLPGGGELAVSWDASHCDLFTLTMEAPEGTSGTIRLPARGTPEFIYLDGALLWEQGDPLTPQVEMAADGILLHALPGGSHEVRMGVAACQAE